MPEQVEQTPQPQPAQAAMSDDATCGLAYITFIPAIVFLVTAPYNQNPKVRFHAWQSIFLGIGSCVVWMVLVVLGMIPLLNLLDIILMPLVGLALLALWLVIMINAFMGKMIKIPVLYGLAAKQARL